MVGNDPSGGSVGVTVNSRSLPPRETRTFNGSVELTKNAALSTSSGCVIFQLPIWEVKMANAAVQLRRDDPAPFSLPQTLRELRDGSLMQRDTFQIRF